MVLGRFWEFAVFCRRNLVLDHIASTAAFSNESMLDALFFQVAVFPAGICGMTEGWADGLFEPISTIKRAFKAEEPSGFLGSLMAAGKKVGLFDAITAFGPVTSKELARQSNCHLRQIEEWLGIMRQYGVVEYERQTARFSLPA